MDMNEEKLKDIKSFQKNAVHVFISLNVCIFIVLPPEGSCDSRPVIQLSLNPLLYIYIHMRLFWFTSLGRECINSLCNYSEKL